MHRSLALALFGVLMIVCIGLVPTYAEGDKPLISARVFNQLSFVKTNPCLVDGRFLGNDRGIVVDRYLGFEWIVGPDEDTTWDEAKLWVESLSGVDGEWRMPEREELRSLYIKDAGTFNMSPKFKIRPRFVWTGEMVDSSHAWGFCYANGNEFWPRLSYSQGARVFAVRFRKSK